MSEQVTGQDPVVEDTQQGSTAAEEQAPRRKKAAGWWSRTPLWAKIVVPILVIALGVGAYIWTQGTPKMPWNDAKPVADGAVLIVPDNLDGGLGNDKFKELTTESEAKDPDHVRYEDPQDMDQYRRVSDDGQVTYVIPVDGPCPKNENGTIGAPSNYRHACYYQNNGAVVYTAHAVRGPRVGALENIGLLKEGQVVTLEDTRYKVKGVPMVFAANKLPEYLFEQGTVMLLTCHIDAAVDAGAPFDKSDVVILEKM